MATSAGVNGLDPGEYKIAVSYEVPAVEGPDGNAVEQKSPVPESYASAENSGLSITIKAGQKNQIDIELSSEN
ncbi:MAG: hypothetical protein R3C49_05885 [Planctomycetaceae bacterium]